MFNPKHNLLRKKIQLILKQMYPFKFYNYDEIGRFKFILQRAEQYRLASNLIADQLAMHCPTIWSLFLQYDFSLQFNWLNKFDGR